MRLIRFKVFYYYYIINYGYTLAITEVLTRERLVRYLRVYYRCIALICITLRENRLKYISIYIVVQNGIFAEIFCDISSKVLLYLNKKIK